MLDCAHQFSGGGCEQLSLSSLSGVPVIFLYEIKANLSERRHLRSVV